MRLVTSRLVAFSRPSIEPAEFPLMMISALPSEAVNKMAFSSLPDHSKVFSALPLPTIH
jgi:hypothetical protein